MIESHRNRIPLDLGRVSAGAADTTVFQTWRFFFFPLRCGMDFG